MNFCLLSVSRILAVIMASVLLVACGGGGGGGGDDNPPPSGGEVTVSGRITFDRPQFSTQLGSGLALANPVESPARDVVVEAIQSSSNAILASTTTNASGDYSLLVPANRSIFIRAKAQMVKTGTAPTWNFRVLNNANGDALFALDGTAFDTGAANSTRNLHAPSGWGTTTYSGTRAAAPFAILDTVYEAKELILGAAPTAVFPDLDLFWSPSNRTATTFCPNDGNIGTTFYQSPGGRDECTTPADLPAGIYILGDFAAGAGDTDEFDAHVVVHEFGHYFEDRFSRSDSLGGAHAGPDRLDFRVAFGEGWGNAYSGMALDDPEYRDSYNGIATDFGFNMESDLAPSPGWYSEVSASKILWDIYDSGAEPGDTVELGFAPIYSVMTGPQVTTDALTSIFTFADAIKTANPASSAAIDVLLSGENIVASDEFGSTETNNGGDSRVLPIYRDIDLNDQLSVCTDDVAGSVDNNKLGNRKFLRFVNDAARTVTIQASGAAVETGTVPATDPDIVVFLRGDIVAAGTLTGQTETMPAFAIDAGTHIIEVYDFDLQNDSPSPPRCMTVSIAG